MGACQSESFDYSKLGTGSINVKLTEEDMSLIRASWDTIKNCPDVGMAIMIRIFKVHSSVKHVWIFAQNLTTEEEMRNDSQIKYHSVRLLNSFGKIISDLDEDLHKHQDYLIDLGAKHYHYDVKYEYFENFQEAFFYTLKNNMSSEIYNKNTKEAWKKLVLLIAEYICMGIRKEFNKQ